MEYRDLTENEIRDLESRILFEDNHLLVINKRVGEIVQADKTGDECLCETLKSYIAKRDAKPGKVFMGLPHRLDRPVSGVCVFAKTSKALERLNEMFRGSQMHKTYLALCCGCPPQKEAELADYLWRNEKQNKSYVCGEDRKGAKLARLRYSLIGKTDRYYLLSVELLTGRHHQIRCQLSNMGCVIKGDLKYGAPRSNPDAGICLHAYSIEFTHPVKKEPIRIEAPILSSWSSIVNPLLAEENAHTR